VFRGVLISLIVHEVWAISFSVAQMLPCVKNKGNMILSISSDNDPYVIRISGVLLKQSQRPPGGSVRFASSAFPGFHRFFCYSDISGKTTSGWLLISRPDRLQ